MGIEIERERFGDEKEWRNIPKQFAISLGRRLRLHMTEVVC